MPYTRNTSKDLVYNSETDSYEPAAVDCVLTIVTNPGEATVTFSTGVVSGKSVTVPSNTTLSYTVSCTGYITQTNIYTVTQTETILAPALIKENYILTVNPTPADATVTFDTSISGGTVSGNSITVPYNTEITYSVSHTGYATISNQTYVVNKTETINAPELSKNNYTLTVDTTPADAIVTFNTGIVSGHSCTIPYETEVTYTISKEGYATSIAYTRIITGNETVNAPALTKNNYTITVNTTPSDATVNFSTGTISGHNCTVPYETTVTYIISKEGYITSQEYSKLVTQNENITAPALQKSIVTLTINPNPSDARVTLTAEGYQQEGNSITVSAGIPITYSVYKKDYKEINDTITLTDDQTLNITLQSKGSRYLVKDLDTKKIFTQKDVIETINLQDKPWVNNSMVNAFRACVNLTSVKAINNSVTNMSGAFASCRNLIQITSIPNSVTDMSSTFSGCSNLVNFPEIPTSVTNLFMTFADCTNLVNTPVIPNSVTSMTGTFLSCTNLVNAPEIPNSVNSMLMTFKGCSNLNHIGTIPNSITDMTETFYGCNNLIGDIYIESNKITSTTNCFSSTSSAKNIYIPFRYENGVTSATYNAFTNAGYSTTVRKDGALLFDINPMPASTDYEYIILTSGTADLTKYIGSGGAIVTPTIIG